MGRFTKNGRVVQTSSLRGFLLLYFVASLRRIRPVSLRYATEQQRITAWWTQAMALLPQHADLALEVLRAQQLVKGYGDTHARGWRSYERLIGALPQLRARADAPATFRELSQAALADGLVWEHYRADWSVDWDYNKDDKTNIFRPWGFQPGHLTEWAKLLLLLDQRRPRADHLPRARFFFDTAMAKSWDAEHGGLYYGMAPDGSICDDGKYHWVQAESMAAAAVLAVRTGDDRYWQWYDRIWAYCWEHFVDHNHGAWFRILHRDNRNTTREKSNAGKVDYHNMGACFDVLGVVGR